jgi:hypothetical protein
LEFVREFFFEALNIIFLIKAIAYSLRIHKIALKMSTDIYGIKHELTIIFAYDSVM